MRAVVKMSDDDDADKDDNNDIMTTTMTQQIRFDYDDDENVIKMSTIIIG